MKINSIMGILRLFKKKATKLCALGLTLIGLMISGSSSFAKYQHVEFGDIVHADVTKPPISTTPSVPFVGIYIKNVEVVQDSNKINGGVNYILPTELDANVNVSNNSSITYKVTVHNKTDVIYWYIGQYYNSGRSANNLINNSITVTTKDKLNDSSATFDTNDWVPAQTERDFYVTYTYASGARGELSTLINFKFDIKMDSVYDGFLAVLNDKTPDQAYDYLADVFNDKYKEDKSTVINNMGEDKVVFNNIFGSDLSLTIDGNEVPVTVFIQRDNLDGTSNGDKYDTNGAPTGCEYTLYITVDDLSGNGTVTVYAISYSCDKNGNWYQLGQLYEGTCDKSELSSSPENFVNSWKATPNTYKVTDAISYKAGQSNGDQYDIKKTLKEILSVQDQNFCNAIENSRILINVYSILDKNKNSDHPAIIQLRKAFENMSPFYTIKNNGAEIKVDTTATRSILIPYLIDIQEAIDYYNQTVAAAANKN